MPIPAIDYRFCNMEGGFSDRIIPMIASGIFNGTAIDKVTRRYRDMAENFDRPLESWKYEGPLNAYKDLLVHRNEINYPMEGKHTRIGIDLPVWFNHKKENPRVMLVAMEPLRTAEAAPEDYASVSTPFALASLQLQHKISWRVVYRFIQDLIQNQCAVYVTDLGKVYSLYNGGKHTGNFARNKTIFLEEIELFQPDCIVTFGKHVHENARRIIAGWIPGIKCRILPFTHPAAFGGNKKYWRQFEAAMASSNPQNAL